jgi:DNA-binding NtrC family response regulator
MADTLLVIEDEDLLANELARHYRKSGWEVVRAADVGAAKSLLREKSLGPLVVLSDMNLPDGNALDLLEWAHQNAVGGEWILLTAYGTIPDSVRALRLGAFEFLEKPCPIERLDLVVAGASRSARAQQRLRDQTAQRNRRYSPEAFVGPSPTTNELRRMMRKLSDVPLTAIIITGETGTGKGLAARILHYSGARASGPLVEVNCAALPAELLESEIFGHESGAFTGAKGRHRGLLEQANGGTIFLDEITELGPGLQAKLLKAIEDRSLRRIGGEREIEVDVQVLAASNRDLNTEVADGTFRSDLYHRLSVFTLDIPPLRSRVEDLEELVPLFVGEFNAVAGKRVQTIPDQAWNMMHQYAWPGNVREVRNAIERCVLLSDGEHLPVEWLQLGRPSSPDARQPLMSADTGTLRLPLDGSLSLDDMEKAIIEQVLDRTHYNVSASARTLGTTRQTLRYRVEKHRIDIPDCED